MNPEKRSILTFWGGGGGGGGVGHPDRVKLKLFPVTISFHSCQVLSKIWLSPMGGVGGGGNENLSDMAETCWGCHTICARHMVRR